jgi:hypothetical protein
MKRKNVRIKTRLNRKTGAVTLTIHARDLREVLVAAALHGYESLEKRKGEKGRHVAESNAYDHGMIQFTANLQRMLENQTEYPPDGPDPLTLARSVEERRDTLQAAQKERKFYDSLLHFIRTP